MVIVILRQVVGDDAMRAFLVFYIKFLVIYWFFYIFLFYTLGWFLTLFIMFLLLMPSSLFMGKIVESVSIVMGVSKNEIFMGLAFQHWLYILLTSLHILFVALLIFFIKNNWNKK